MEPPAPRRPTGKPLATAGSPRRTLLGPIVGSRSRPAGRTVVGCQRLPRPEPRPPPVPAISRPGMPEDRRRHRWPSPTTRRRSAGPAARRRGVAVVAGDREGPGPATLAAYRRDARRWWAGCGAGGPRSTRSPRRTSRTTWATCAPRAWRRPPWPGPWCPCGRSTASWPRRVGRRPRSRRPGRGPAGAGRPAQGAQRGPGRGPDRRGGRRRPGRPAGPGHPRGAVRHRVAHLRAGGPATGRRRPRVGADPGVRQGIEGAGRAGRAGRR